MLLFLLLLLRPLNGWLLLRLLWLKLLTVMKLVLLRENVLLLLLLLLELVLLKRLLKLTAVQARLVALAAHLWLSSSTWSCSWGQDPAGATFMPRWSLGVR